MFIDFSFSVNKPAVSSLSSKVNFLCCGKKYSLKTMIMNVTTHPKGEFNACLTILSQRAV